MYPIDETILSQIKPSFVTRRVDRRQIAWVEADADNLETGDLVLARVEEVGQHTRIERPDGRRALLFPGDDILVSCGARYAPDQFEANCPATVGAAQLVAAGGIAGIVQGMHDRMKPATQIAIRGAVCNRSGQRMNLKHYRVKTGSAPTALPVLAVCGTSMNSGKTHTVASLVRGFALAGHKAAAIKVTGTGAGGDLWFYRDSGAYHVRDFTDAGFASTYRVPVGEIFQGLGRLLADAEAAGAEVAVVEIADGLMHSETAALLELESFRGMLTSLVFAACDSMGALAGVSWLRRAGLPLQAVSGCLTRSPLAMREITSAVDLPCLTPGELQTPEVVSRLAQGVPPLRMRTAA